MSNAIANLLDKPENLVQAMIQKLEDLNGQTSEDVRLLANNMQKLRAKVSQLGLDPSDTTSEELYHSLRVKFAKDSAQLDRALGAGRDASIELRTAKASQLVAGLGVLPEMWLLKHSAAKALIRQLPPKKLMKKLNYQSVESLLKRENIDNIFLASAALESAAWRASLSKKITKLGSASFEMRRLHVTALPASYNKKITEPMPQIIIDSGIGAVAGCQSGLPGNATTLSIAVLLLNGLEELSGTDLSQEFYTISPALRWWSNNSSLISNHNSGPVSLNIKDISQDSLYNHDYTQRAKQHGAKALMTTLLSRYQNQSDRVSSTIKEIGYDLSPAGAATPGVPFGAQLVPEYEVAE